MKKLVLIAGLLASACSYTDSVEVAPETGGPLIKGVRYFAQKPILIIQDGQAQVTFIPNKDKEYAVRFGAFLAKNDTTVTLHPNGTIASVASKLDSTDALDSFETGLQQLTDVLREGASEAETDKSSSSGVRVYDFIFDGKGNIVELRPLL